MKYRALSASLLFLSTGCGVFGLSQAEEERVTEYRVRANKYFDHGAKSNDATWYLRSLDQLQKALAIDPDNYRARSRQGWCYLMLGNRDKRYLTEAERSFKGLMPARSDRDHDARTILGYGLTLHRIGFNGLSEANLLEQEATSQTTAPTDEIANPKARAAEKRNRAMSYLASAERQLRKLLTLDEWVRVANEHLMNLKVHQGDIEGALKHGQAMLVQLAKEQTHWEKKYQSTTVKGYENEVRRALAEIVREELRVRTEMADYYYKLKRHDKAVAELDKVLRINPNLADRYYDRGVCLRALGRTDDAKRDFKKFLGTTNRPSKDKKVVDAYEFTYG